MDNKQDRKFAWYTCGKCGQENYRSKDDQPDDCVECGSVYGPSDGEVGANTTNPTFEDWTAGSPDGWTLSGAGASVAQESTIVNGGSYSAKLTRSGADCYLYQSIHSGLGIAYWNGRTVRVGVMVYATVADRARLAVTDGVNTETSDYHSGGSSWEYLYVDMPVNGSELTLQLQINDGDTDAYFDDVCQNPASSGGRLIETRQWEHRTRKPSDIPDEIKLDLNNPNG